MIIHISVKSLTAHNKLLASAREGKTTEKRDGELGKETEREGGNRAEEYGTDIKESRIIQPQDE